MQGFCSDPCHPRESAAKHLSCFYQPPPSWLQWEEQSEALASEREEE
jgi:hypothetical protein